MAGLAFRPTQRLLQADQFKQVFDHSCYKVHQPAFMLLAIPATQPRLGIIAAKKKLRHAHDRNRFKRLVRESFRLNQHQLAHIDVVVMAKQDALNTNNEELFKQLKTAWYLLGKKVKRNTENTTVAS